MQCTVFSVQYASETVFYFQPQWSSVHVRGYLCIVLGVYCSMYAVKCALNQSLSALKQSLWSAPAYYSNTGIDYMYDVGRPARLPGACAP